MGIEPSNDRRRLLLAARVVALALAAAVGGLLFAPAPAAAADLFPVDDWLGAGAEKLKDVTFGAGSFGVEEIGGLIVNLIAALVDLLVPESLVKQGMKAVRWLVSVPVFGDVPARGGGIDPSFPHLGQLRDALTWIGITLLPLAIIVTVARGWFDPRLDGDPPEQILLRIAGAGVLLALYDTVWYAVTKVTGLITGAILSLPWVAKGTERMLEFLLIGGGAGTAVAAEFIVPLLMLFAAIAFLGVLLLKIGLTVLAAVLYASGGLVVGLSPSAIGRRLLTAWGIALGSVAVIPILWAIIFAAASALTLDAASPTAAARAGAPKLISQLFLGAAALAAFWMALSVGKAALGSARSAISSLSGSGSGGGGGGKLSSFAASRGAERIRPPAALQSFGRSVGKAPVALAGGALSGAGQLAAAGVGRKRPAGLGSAAAQAAVGTDSPASPHPGKTKQRTGTPPRPGDGSDRRRSSAPSTSRKTGRRPSTAGRAANKPAGQSFGSSLTPTNRPNRPGGASARPSSSTDPRAGTAPHTPRPRIHPPTTRPAPRPAVPAPSAAKPGAGRTPPGKSPPAAPPRKSRKKRS